MENEIDKYIATFPKDVQVLLNKIRETIQKAAPKAEQKISYAMPTFYLEGNLVHFAGYKNHIGFYPAPSGLKAFEAEISKYKNSKGAVQFPIDKALPLSLITKIVKFRVKENLEKINSKKTVKVQTDFTSVLSAPARRALQNNNITTLKQLSTFTEAEVLQWHGIGASSIPKLKLALAQQKLSFKKK